VRLIREARYLEHQVNYACSLDGLNTNQIAFREGLLAEAQRLKEQMVLLTKKLQAIENIENNV
jgi:hypothetical protein